ncbi:Transcriptional regulator (fragment) [Petrocella atlantisensis]|uniref:Transcriptional regulator n=2 Tax=Petrocella atlantisensis TaxID=2173034 RepID=A0A3P7S2Z7_9FIRM
MASFGGERIFNWNKWVYGIVVLITILEKHVIKFSYSSAKKQTTSREVEPLKLCFKGGAWYLYGYCRARKDMRFFKLRRIKELIVEDKIFQRKKPKQIFLEKEVFQEDFILLKLKLSEKMEYRVFDEFEVYEQQEDGSYIVEIKYPKGEWIFYYIMSFGSHCQVLEPEFVRKEIQAELEKILEYYF